MNDSETPPERDTQRLLDWLDNFADSAAPFIIYRLTNGVRGTAVAEGAIFTDGRVAVRPSGLDHQPRPIEVWESMRQVRTHYTSTDIAMVPERALARSIQAGLDVPPMVEEQLDEHARGFAEGWNALRNQVHAKITARLHHYLPERTDT